MRLHANAVMEMEEKFSDILVESEDINVLGEVLPVAIYQVAPSYVRRLADQINASFEHKIYDGCAVLMRRLLEVLLIKTYIQTGQEASIQNSDQTYKMLDSIVRDARVNSAIGLSRNTRERLEDFRQLGNFAAHKVEFSTRRGDLSRIQLDYRAAVEELLHKSGLIP